MSSEGSNERTGLGHGLPRLLADDPNTLNDLLGLSRQERLRIGTLVPKAVRARIDAALKSRPEPPRPGERDRVLVQVHYQHPLVRQAAWYVALERGPGGKPSPEATVLADFVAAERDTREGTTEASADDRTESERIADRAWSATRERLGRWEELDEPEREQCTLRAFAVATIRDDAGVLVEACELVSDLREQFGRFLPEPEDDAADSRPEAERASHRWVNLTRSLRELMERAEGPPPNPDLLPDITSALESLRELAPSVRAETDRTAFDLFLHEVREQLSEIQSDSTFGLDEGRSAEIQAAWEQQRGALAGETLRKARHQFNAAVGGAVNEMRRAAQDLAEVKDRIAQHRAEEPDDPFGQDAWDEHLEDLQRAERRGRKRRRDARSALLTALAPAGVPISPAAKTPPAKPNEPKPEPPESEPPGSAPPEPERPQPAPPESKVPKPEPPEAEPPQAEQPPPESPGQQPPEFEPLEPAPPEPELPETPSAEAPKRDPLAVKAEEAITAALVEQPPRLAYAFQVARLSERVVPGEWSSPSALIEAALLADRLELPDGVIAGRLGELFQVFPALTAADKSGDERAFSTAAAFAGSVLPAVFAPNTGAFAILASIPATRPFPFLPELARRVATHAEKLQRARIDASHLNALRSDEERDAARAQSGQALSEWLRDAPRRTMLYAPATAVWKRWLEPNGAIGGLMARIEAENGPRFRAEIGQLRDAGYVKDLVEKTHRELRAGAARRTPIRWRALEKLVHEARRAAELAERYLAHAVPSGSVDFRVEVLTDLRRELDTLAPDAARKCLGCPARFSGAARLVIGAVRRLQAALHPSGDVDAGTEPDPRELRASGFFGTTVVLDEDGEPVGTPRDLLVSLTEQEPLDPVDAVRAHLDRGSLGTARRILDWVAGAGPPGLADIEAEFESARVRHAADRKQQLAPLRARLETGLRLGTISADEREQINADLVGAEHQLSNPDFLRFAELRRRLEGIESGLATMEESSRKRIRHELAGLALGPDSPSAAAIQRAIDDGDIVAANELIQRVREDPAVLITDEEASDGRRAFSPDTATTIAAALENAGSPREVMRRIAAGHSFAGVPGDLPEARRESAARMLTAWFTLKRSRVIGAGGTGSVASLFSEIGFRVRDVEPGDGSTSEVRLRTDPLRSRDQCPVPAYGSAAGGRYRVIGVWRQPTIDDLLRFADEPGAAPPVVLYFGRLSEQQRTRLALATRERAQAILVLDEPAVLFLCGVRDSRLSVFFDCTLPFSYVQPYSAVGGAAPPEMFYGRDTELASITSRNGPCFVYGGRQIGKTAILRRARDREHRPADGRYVFFVDLKAQGIGVEGSVADLWRLLWRLLRDENAIPKDVREPVTKGRGRIEEFLDALIRHFDPDSGRTLLLLLDEADNFLAMDAREQQRDLAATGFRESNRLKRLMDETQRSIKVVFAGLHNVLRTVEQANHPLGQFGRPVQVRPLLRNGGERAARDLAIRPLRAAGYRFDPQDLVTRILGQTNYYPGLIQAYCAELIEAMLPRCAGAPPYSVTPEVLAAAYRADGLREFIRKRFHLTLELDKRYEVIAYVTAWLCLEEEGVLATGIARRRLLDQVRDWWPAGFGDLNDEEFGALLDETVGLGVLRRAKPDGTAYTLRNPNVLLLMGTKDEIEAKLLQEPEPPQDLEPRILRARRNPNDPEDPLRSPLTFRQQRQLFAEEDGVILLAGVPAAGLDDVLEAHESLPERPLVRLDGALDREFFRSGLSGSVKRQEEGVRVHAVPPEALWTDEWVQDAERHLKRLRKSDRHVRVLFLAAGDRVAALLADEGLRKMPRLERIYLQPWHEGFVRQWMQDVGVGDSADLRARILDLTGGWPLALMRIPDLLRVHGVAERALDDLDHEFADPGQQRDWLHHLCLEDPVTRRVLRPIATFEELSRQDALDEAVADGLDREEAETRLRAAGHLGLARSTPTWSLNPLVARLLKDEQSD